jgi:transcription initiation factor TFIID subunit 2
MTKQDMSAFIARWIEGCGCPRLTAGYTFRKTRRQELLFAIKLDGCLAAAAADRVAWSKNPKVSVTVRIQENDLPPSDHAVSLSAHDRAYVLMPLQLVTKPKDRRTIARQQAAALNRQQKAREEGVANPDSLDAMAAAEVLQWECPVSWVRVDPEGEWLAKVILPPAQQGLEGMITKQLMSERPADPSAQTWAIRFLQERAEHGSTSAVNALLQCAEDPKIFCRVRAAAAMALGACACDGTQRSNLALSSVTRTYRKRRCDPETGKPAPTDLTDFAAAIVDEGLVTALGLPRAPPEGAGRNGGDESTWVTPSECVELLVDMLDGLQSDGDPHDPSSLIARAIHALGDARPATLDALLQIVRAIAKRMRENANICGVGGRAHEGGRRVTVAGMLALRSLLSRIPPLPESLSAANEAKKALAAEPKSKRRGGGVRWRWTATWARGRRSASRTPPSAPSSPTRWKPADPSSARASTIRAPPCAAPPRRSSSASRRGTAGSAASRGPSRSRRSRVKPSEAGAFERLCSGTRATEFCRRRTPPRSSRHSPAAHPTEAATPARRTHTASTSSSGRPRRCE